MPSSQLQDVRISAEEYEALVLVAQLVTLAPLQHGAHIPTELMKVANKAIALGGAEKDSSGQEKPKCSIGCGINTVVGGDHAYCQCERCHPDTLPAVPPSRKRRGARRTG
jgi:hypothetical protein